MKLRLAKYYFSKYNGFSKYIDTDVFMSKCFGLLNITYMSTWYILNKGFYAKFTKSWPRCYSEKDKKQKLFTYNSNHHLLIKVEKCYTLF